MGFAGRTEPGQWFRAVLRGAPWQTRSAVRHGHTPAPSVLGALFHSAVLETFIITQSRDKLVFSTQTDFKNNYHSHFF